MPPPKKKTKNADGRLSFRLDGVDYHLDFAAIENRQELELFQQSGLTLGQVARALGSGSPPPFAVAAVMFIARRQAGDRAVRYDALLDSIDRTGSTFEAVPEDDAPEA